MEDDLERADEASPLLNRVLKKRRRSRLAPADDLSSIISSHVSRDEQALALTGVGERLPYNDYSTIDWLHDLVKDSFRHRAVESGKGFRRNLRVAFDRSQGWIACGLIGFFTAVVAFFVDVAVETVSDWKLGYCTSNPLRNRGACCQGLDPGPGLLRIGEGCPEWRYWAKEGKAYPVFVAWALLFGVISGGVTMLTKAGLPSANDMNHHEATRQDQTLQSAQQQPGGKVMYMAAGSGIPEIKTVLSGFVIKGFLSYRVMTVKAVGAVFAVATGMCLGKEGPFVHISTCVGYIVGNWFPKYNENGRKLRELLSAACSSGLSVAFGAPIGGVLFSYEEISTYFPRRVLWRAFFCSLTAAATLRMLNPTGTGKLVLFETDYGTSYSAIHYLVFIFLGVAGGLFGGVFCKVNFIWSKWFRKFSIIKNHPVFETFLVVLLTAATQYPNPLTRQSGDVIMKRLLVSCENPRGYEWVCDMEAQDETNWPYIGWLVHGTLIKLVLTIITFGIKVPSGIIIPSLDAGAFFGRLIGQFIPGISPGIFAMVGSAAFLAGVSRMTISLCVIMFELTGELEYIVPHMIAILVAKWIADAMEKEGVYDLAQAILGHPFLDQETSISITREQETLVEALIPPRQTMDEITVEVPKDGYVERKILEKKLGLLKRRGLMDAGLVLTQGRMLQGYLAEGELDFALTNLDEKTHERSAKIRVLAKFGEETSMQHFSADGTLHGLDNDVVDISMFVDRTPLTINAKAPMEYAVEMFGKLGLRYLCVLDGASGRLVGVVIKKRLVAYLEHAKE